MKRVGLVTIFTAAIFMVASAGYAPCFYPQSRHVDYYQHHIIGTPPYLVTYWQLDGFCDTDCSGNTSCSGDTHIDDQTLFDVTTGECSDPICTD